MINISQGKIRLENKVIDISRFEIRPKTTEKDLEKYYDCFIEHAEEVGNYFEDRNAFDKALRNASEEKHPKLVPRNPKYPLFWDLRTTFLDFSFMNPQKRRLHDKYFMCAHCTTAIPQKKKTEKGKKHLDEKLRQDIAEKFKQYSGYEGIIEIPNDRTPPETKADTFHESLHYLMFRYQAETNRNFVNVFVREELTQLEKYQAEYVMHERAVEILTDKLLTHDPDAQFESRWPFYSLSEQSQKFKLSVIAPTAIATGVLLGLSISKPYLLPFALVPGKIRDYALEKYKKSKREEILKPIEYPEFKI